MFFTVLCLVVLLGLGGLTGWWFFLASFGERVVAHWESHAQEHGWKTRHAGLERGGFPFRVTLTLASPRLRGDTGDGAHVDWRGDALRFEASVWRPRHVRFMVLGDQEAVYAPDGGLPVHVAADTVEGAWEPLGRGWRLVGHSRTIVASPVDEPSERLLVKRLDLDLDLSRIADEVHALLIEAQARNVTLPRDAPFGREIALLDVDGRLEPPPPDGFGETELTAWRAAGGQATINVARVEWGPVTLGSRGSLSLDAALRPEGTMQIEVTGYREGLEALAGAGIIEEGAIPALATVFGLFAETDASGRSTARAPLAFRDGWLFVGPARIAELAPVCDC